ncbi:hypothetical protein J3F83DRAFT_730369 [Trichoderma novae-zelandiae]
MMRVGCVAFALSLRLRPKMDRDRKRAVIGREEPQAPKRKSWEMACTSSRTAAHWTRGRRVIESSRVEPSRAHQLNDLASVTAADSLTSRRRPLCASSGQRGLRTCLGSEAARPTNHPGRPSLGSPTPKRIAERRRASHRQSPAARKASCVYAHTRRMYCRFGAGAATRST